MFSLGIILNPCPKPTDFRCVFFSRKTKMVTQKRNKGGTLIMDMILFSRRRKKSGKWHFIGGFGRQRRAAVFLVPGAAFQKWQSEFAQVLELVKKLLFCG